MYTFREIFTSCKLIFVNYCALTVLFTPVFFSVAHLLVARYHCRYTVLALCRLPLKCDGTRTETSFRLSAKRTSPFKSAGASVQSTTGSRGVRISGSNAGYTIFQGRVEKYWLPTPFACFPFTSPPVRHHVPSHFNWTLPQTI